MLFILVAPFHNVGTTILRSQFGVNDGVGVGVTDEVIVGVIVGVGVTVAVGVGVGVGVTVAVGVGVGCGNIGFLVTLK